MMACETCDHTMQCVAEGKFWCPRCGSLKIDHQTSAPHLVTRVKTMMKTIPYADVKLLSFRIGIDEAIWTPAERPAMVSSASPEHVEAETQRVLGEMLYKDAAELETQILMGCPGCGKRLFNGDKPIEGSRLVEMMGSTKKFVCCVDCATNQQKMKELFSE